MQTAGHGGACAFVSSCLIALVLAGCGGAGKLITSRNGEVESGTLVLDSIPAAPSGEEYIIGQGDRLDILFPFNSEFNQLEVSVRPDGKITIPLMDDVQAAGKTPAMLDSLITLDYAEYIVNPKVAVVVRRYAEQVVYVLGEVTTPGGFPYERGMTLLSALALGRGPTPKAASNGVLVIRKTGPAHIIGIQIDYEEIASGKRLDLNVPLRAGDIVLVPKSRIAKGQDFALMLYDILGKPMELYLKGWQVGNAAIMYDYYKRVGQF